MDTILSFITFIAVCILGWNVCVIVIKFKVAAQVLKVKQYNPNSKSKSVDVELTRQVIPICIALCWILARFFS